MEKTSILQVINESSQINSQKEVRRDYFELLVTTIKSNKLIKVLTGIRRSGKSFLLKQLFHKLVLEGIPKENILFLNFENDLLSEYLTTKGLRDLFDFFESVADAKFPKFVLLDEIQNVKNWYRYIRTIYEQDKYNIYITGSNSELLSGEISTVLGGRVLEFNIRPFNFSELLQFQNIEYKNVYNKVEHRIEIFKNAEDFLNNGAIPESLFIDSSLKSSFRDSLVEKIIYNDILKRHKLDSPEELKNILKFLERSLGGIITVNNLSKNGSTLTSMTIAKYLEYLTQVYLIEPLYKYHFQAKEILKTQKKYYFIDNIFSKNSSLGGKLENLVAVSLFRKYGINKVAFARNDRGQEVDFVILDNEQKVFKAIQVAYELNDFNYAREINSLKLIREYHKEKIQYDLVCVSNLVSEKNTEKFINTVRYDNWLVSL